MQDNIKTVINMAIYRNVQLSFWTDNKVEDDFTPEDKYFYLYLLTNPQTNICGCYEVSYSQMTRQTGYNKETIQRLLERFEKVHNVVRFCKETKEILILHWYRYNWSKSEDTLKGVSKVAEYIKCNDFRNYVFEVVDCVKNNTPIRGSIDPVKASVSDTDTVSDSITDNNKKSKYKDILNNLIFEFNISDYLIESVNEWIEYKKERNFRYKEIGLRKLIKTISENARRYGDSAVATVIAQSISSGYQGITFDRIPKMTNSRQSYDDSREYQFNNLMEQIRRDVEDDG